MYADSLDVAHSVCKVTGGPQAVCLLNLSSSGSAKEDGSST